MNNQSQYRMARLLSILLGLLLCSANVTALGEPEETSSAAADVSAQSPFVNMNVEIEIQGLESAATQAAEGLKMIGQSLQDLAARQDLTPEENAHIELALNQVNNLGEHLSQAVQSLPGTVEKSIAPVVSAGYELSGQVRTILIIACVVLILIVVAALAAVYKFVLTPATQAIIETTGLLDDLATTLKTTADIVEISSSQNLKVLDEMRQLQDQSGTPTVA